eukprot:scaffold883_cov325-Pavlova_lutheri.AAC.12
MERSPSLRFGSLLSLGVCFVGSPARPPMLPFLHHARGEKRQTFACGGRLPYLPRDLGLIHRPPPFSCSCLGSSSIDPTPPSPAQDPMLSFHPRRHVFSLLPPLGWDRRVGFGGKGIDPTHEGGPPSTTRTYTRGSKASETDPQPRKDRVQGRAGTVQDVRSEAGAGKPAEESARIGQGPGDRCQLRLQRHRILAASHGLLARGTREPAAEVGRVRTLPMRQEHLHGCETEGETKGERLGGKTCDGGNVD